MIYNSHKYVSNELEILKTLRKKYINNLQGLPEGSLFSNKVKNGVYYVKVLNGKREYLGDSQNKDVQLLQKKYFLSESIERIDNNIKVMESLIKNYKSIDPNILIDQLPQAYKSLPQHCFDIGGAIDLKKWGRGPYHKSEKYSEGLRHKTVQGYQVRSKSEVAIANLLYSKGIECHYEETLTLPDTTLVPDFKIAVKSENRFKFLEHVGMLYDEEYKKQFVWKLNKYIENGILPWRDLILTFDDEKGNIDIVEINKIIDTFLV